METIRVYGPDGWRDAECLEERGGLAVTKHPGGPYTVTHCFSGLTVVWGYGQSHMASAAMGAALTMPVDWTQPDEVVKASLDAAGLKELRRRMKLAATPPKRLRWHDARPRNRYRHAYAELKRQAIRESREVGISWSYFFSWSWDEGWGRILPPRRQRCVRFATVPKLGLVRRLARRNRLLQWTTPITEDRRGCVLWVDGRLSSRWPRR
jgi:hypothetical protein